MSATIWGKFFWADYANDPKLKLCSFAAQGLWMRMLCIAAVAQPAGYVAVNGVALTMEELAQLAGAGGADAVAEVTGLVDELEARGVFSRARGGTIYCRRMLKDLKKAKTARENGKKGGNPTLGKHRENSASDNPLRRQGLSAPLVNTRSQKELGRDLKISLPNSGEKDFKKSWNGPPEIRVAVAAEKGEPWTVSHLDPATWTDGGILAGSSTALNRLMAVEALKNFNIFGKDAA